MKGFLVVLVLFGLAGTCVATSCTNLTLNTCQKTLYATGDCKANVCSCEPGYLSGPFGCLEMSPPPRSVIETNFNGEAENGSSFNLTCTPSSNIYTYTWTHDSTTLPTVSSILHINEASPTDSGLYKCTAKVNDIEFRESVPFTLSVVTSLTTNPTLKGLAEEIVEDMKVKFVCTNLAHGLGGVTPKFYVGGIKMAESTSPVYIHKATKMYMGADAWCENAGRKSEKEVFPSTFRRTLTGVDLRFSYSNPLNLVAGENETEYWLYCDPTDEFPISREDDPALPFVWMKGSTFLAQRKYYLTLSDIDTSTAGDYKCALKDDNSAAFHLSSQNLQVTVNSTFMADGLVISSSPALVLGGYFTLTCDYKTIDTKVPATYLWWKDGNVIAGAVDKILQINEADGSKAGSYVCTATTEAGTVKSAPLNLDMKKPGEITPTVNGDNQIGIRVDATYTCDDTEIITPGMVYIWMVDGAVQTESSRTFSYTSVNAGDTELKCAFHFNGTDNVSHWGSKTISASRVLNPKIVINGRVVTAATPVMAETVTIFCEVEEYGDVKYSWRSDGSLMDDDRNRIEITGRNPTVFSGSNLTCTAASKPEQVEAAVLLQYSSVPSRPVVSVSQSVVYVGGSVNLMCDSDSFSNTASFKWKKDDKVIPEISTYSYTINEVSMEDKGKYSCAIIVLTTVQSQFSQVVNITPKDHMACTFARECDGENFDHTVCQNGKCVCQTGFEFTAGQCLTDFDPCPPLKGRQTFTWKMEDRKPAGRATFTRRGQN